MTNPQASETDNSGISRRTVLEIIGSGSVASLAGCTGQFGPTDGDSDGDSGDSGGSGGMTVTDLIGREVEVPGTVESVLGLGPGGLRLVCQMGAADMVVGVEENEHGWSREIPYNMANPHFQDLPVIGPQFGGAPELIVQHDPDVIFFRGRGGDGASTLQKKTGIPVVSVKQGDFGPNRDVLYTSWKLIGRVLNKQDRATSLKDYVETSIAELNERTKDIPDNEKETVYAGGISHHGPQGLTSTKSPFPPLEFINAKFVAEEFLYSESDRRLLKVTVSREKILAWNPEIIFVDRANLKTVAKGVRKHEGYQTVSAIQNGRVYGYHPYHQYHYNASTTLANSYFMGTVLFSDQFNDISLETKSNEIYKTFLGSPVYNQMVEEFGDYGKVNLRQ
jgi:iron complex transport system substrate-binding protein